MSSSSGYLRGVNIVDRIARRLDRFQQRLSWLAYPFAIAKKFDDDQGGNLAALMAYYAFVSLFPLLLVFTTVLEFVLHDYPGLQRTLLHSALVDFPVIGAQLQTPNLTGNWYALAISLVISFWGAQGVARATQTAFNTVWNVPFINRPSAWGTILRSLGLLAVMGVSILCTGFLSGVGSASSSLGVATRHALELRQELEQPLDLHLLVQSALLRQIADAMQRHGGLAEHRDPPAIRLDDVQDHAQRGSRVRPVGTPIRPGERRWRGAAGPEPSHAYHIRFHRVERDPGL